MSKVEWSTLTAPELREIAGRPDSLAILPAGSHEQHGPHLPVITDTASASAAAIGAARAVAGEVPVAVMPGLWLGMSEHHLPFGGTISLDYAGYFGVLRGIVRSLKAIGFKRLFIVNGHGGNIEPLAVAIRELSVTYAMPIVATTPWLLAAQDMAKVFEADAHPKHACEGETSLMMLIAGEHVRTDKFDQAVISNTEPLMNPAGFSKFRSMVEMGPETGTWGDPRVASKEKGERFLEIQVRELAKAIRTESLWTLPDQAWRPDRGHGSTANTEQ